MCFVLVLLAAATSFATVDLTRSAAGTSGGCADWAHSIGANAIAAITHNVRDKTAATRI